MQNYIKTILVIKIYINKCRNLNP